MIKKQVVAGLGEIGSPILKLLTKSYPAIGYDIDTSRMNLNKFHKYEAIPTSFLHICIPFTDKFTHNVIDLYNKFDPDYIVIHSTISPGTTSALQNKLGIPIIYSATRGVHKRMLYDLRRYTKFFALEKNIPRAKDAATKYSTMMKKIGIKTKQMTNPITLELAKIIVDTSYYGWLITYAQLSNMIAIKHKVNYDEMWTFADEIHKFLGNRPKMFPGFIGGHCLDGNEIIFIKTNLGMKPITIREYVESDHKNDVLSYDVKRKEPFFDHVTAKSKRNFVGTMITLTSRTNRSIRTTDEHLMLASDDLHEVFAKDIRLNDNIPFIASLPNIHLKQYFDFESNNWRLNYNMPKSIKITEDFCRLLGYYVSEGSVSNYGKGYTTRFSFNKNETKYISDVCNILKSLGLNYFLTTQNNVTHVGVKSTPLSLFIADTLGCGRSSNVKCLPEFIYFASRKMKEEFLSGYFRGDGCFMPELGIVQAASSSKILVAGLDILLLSMGYVMTLIQTVNSPSMVEGRIIKGGLLYSLVSKKETQYNDLATIAGFSQSKILRSHTKNLWRVTNENLYLIRTTKTIHEQSEQEVYSIDTKNHLFVSTGGRLIHNCVIPNLDLIKDETLNLINEINNDYAKILKKRQAQGKKY
ncbi:MAG: LAGLIDADG family homing endonuclease [Thermoproteota archaeon]